jgi:hypothetical protein
LQLRVDFKTIIISKNKLKIMKKVLILTMLGFVFSFGAYASGEVKKEKVMLTTSNNEANKVLETKYLDLCLNFEFVVLSMDCPDGSTNIWVGLTATNCDTGQYYRYIDLFSTLDELGEC